MRGQAALEYLVTYGWAFLAIIVMIGALAFFGFLSPSRYLPARCSFGAQLECSDFQLVADSAANGHVYLQFRNNFGDDIRIIDIQTAASLGKVVSPALPLKMAKANLSSTIDFKLSNDDPIFLAQGDRTTVPLIITFSRDQDNAPLHNVTGEIFATVR